MSVKKNTNSAPKKPNTIKKIFIISGIIFALAFVGLTILGMSSSKISSWRSQDGQRQYEDAYFTILKQMPQYKNQFDIKTSYGTVRVYEWSTEKVKNLTPIVLYPGILSGAPMWEENLKGLIDHRPVYIIDALGDSGMSKQTKPIKDAADQAKWIDETFDKLNLKKAHMIGHSYGGWLAANYASRYPAKVKTLSLLEPIRVMTDMKLDIYISSIASAIPFMPKTWKDDFLKKVGGSSDLDPNDPMTKMISAASENYSRALPHPELITSEQMKSWRMPVYIALGEKSAMHDSTKAMEVAKSNIKNLDIKIWSGGTHSLPMDFADQIDQEIIKFTSKNDT